MTLVEYINLIFWTSGSIAGPLIITQAAVKPEFNKKVGKQLILFTPGEWARNLPSLTVNIFNNIFGEKLPSKKSFLCSSIISISLLTIFFTIYVFNSTKYVNFDLFSHIEPEGGISVFVLVVILTYSLNILPDYISLIETKFIISKLSNNPSTQRTLIFLLIDFAATAIIYTGFFYMIMLTFTFLQLVGKIRFVDGELLWYSLNHFNLLVINLNTSLPKGEDLVTDLLHFSYYTTFITTIWTLLFSFLSIFMITMQKVGGPLWTTLSRTVLNVEEKPFQSLAWVGGVFVVFIYLVLAPFVFMGLI